jgi:hypothetical protein
LRIPWGRAGLVYVVVAPIAIGSVALLGSDRFALRWRPVAIRLGPVAYLLVREIHARHERKLQLTQSRNL